MKDAITKNRGVTIRIDYQCPEDGYGVVRSVCVGTEIRNEYMTLLVQDLHSELEKAVALVIKDISSRTS